MSKVLLQKTLVRPIMLYGAEWWTLYRTDEKIVDSFEGMIYEECVTLLRTEVSGRAGVTGNCRLSVVIRTARL